MTKRKGRGFDQPNLKRFRASVEELAAATPAGIGSHEEQGVKKVSHMPRKAKRKEMRKLKKMRKAAYLQKKTLPTMESLNKEKEDIRKADSDKRKKQRKRQKERERKKKKKAEIAEEEDSRIQGLREANKREEKQIKQLEKQLKLNKRKGKNLPKSFEEDGLGYILDVVDSEKIKAIYEDGSDLEDDLDLGSDLGSAFDSDGSGDDIEKDDNDDEGPEDQGLNVDDDREEEDNDDEEEEEEDNSLGSEQEDDSDRDEVMTGDDSDNDDITGDIVENSGGDDDELNDSNKLLKKSKDGKLKKTTTNSMQEKELKVRTTGKTKKDKLSKNTKSTRWKDGEETESSEMEESDTDDMAACAEEAGDSATEGEEREDSEQTEYREDIYGRLRDRRGNIVQGKGHNAAYVPPGKRLEMMEGRSERKRVELERLKKQLKGLVNRVSESNMQPISHQIEDLFRRHSRADMNGILTSLVLESCTSNVLVPEKLVLDIVMLVAILHGNVGSEVGAHFIQTIAVKFDSLFRSSDNYGGNKEADNLLLILAHLYNFKVTHWVLVVDVMSRLADRFQEKDIELLLLLLKNAGFSLRKDDPAALREIIVKIQSKASSVDTAQFEDRSRVQFMLDVLLAIKNNNMRKIPNYDPSHMEHMKKLLRNYVRGTADTQLRISLQDLLDAEEHGRWWIVGSAWSGKQMEQQEAAPTKMDSSVLSDVSSHILELARKQRMNTDVRKNIFCIIMTSEDFVDAFEKLLQLGLKHQQEREIIHVILDCCVQERVHNAFYSYLLQKFCEYDRRFEMTLQFSLWDKFKTMSSVTQTAATNLAAMIAHLLATKALSLSIFKVVEFSELDKSMVKFLKDVLVGLLTLYDETIVKETFLRIAPFPKLHMLREGLKLFLDHFILRKLNKELLNKDDLEVKVSIAKRSLSAGESSLKL